MVQTPKFICYGRKLYPENVYPEMVTSKKFYPENGYPDKFNKLNLKPLATKIISNAICQKLLDFLYNHYRKLTT